MNGNQITRKCMNMWGHRLCLCQFLNWMDSHKYKCLPSGASGYGYVGGDDGGNGGNYNTGTTGGGFGILPNNGLHQMGTFTSYHSYGSPGITHSVSYNHDPLQVKHEVIHEVNTPRHQVHEATIKMKVTHTNLGSDNANQNEYGDYYGDYDLVSAYDQYTSAAQQYQ
eukprot:363032_1